MVVYTRKTKLFKLPGTDIITLTNHLDVSPDTRGWKKAIQYLNLNIGEVRRCEMGGGAGPFVELLCQRGWNVGKTMDMLTKIGNEAAVTSLSALLSDKEAPCATLSIKGETELKIGARLKLAIEAPNRYNDIQWYFETTCLRAEKSRVFILEEVTTENSGRYKVRLEANTEDIQWLFIDVAVNESGSAVNTEKLKFVLQPQDFIIKEENSKAHFFVDVRPYIASLQWYSDGLLIHGETQPYLVVHNLNKNAHRRQFKCTATLANQAITSNVALIRWESQQPKEFTGESFVETATDKVALIIGNQKYHEPSFSDIVHAEDDARDISECLRQLQFKVVSLINLTKDEMLIACENFYKLLNTGVYGVFYFAGHGFEFGGENYLIPVDAPSNVRVEHCLKAQFVLHRMQFRDTKLNLLLLDMCRDQFNNVGLPHDMQPVPSFGNTAIGFACGPGFRAYGSEYDKNGIYVKYLQEHITRNITVTNLLDCVNKAIGLQEPNIDQRPHYQSSIIKNISLNDPIDTTNHTVEFHNRSVIWSMANQVDKTLEELTVGEVKVEVQYKALFSNVLQFTVSTQLPLNLVVMDQDSVDNGLVLLQLEESCYEIKNIQKLKGAHIQLAASLTGLQDPVLIRIDRPLFAKITANVANFGSVLNVDLSGAHRTNMCQVPTDGACRGGAVSQVPSNPSTSKYDKDKARAAKKLAEMEHYDKKQAADWHGPKSEEIVNSKAADNEVARDTSEVACDNREVTRDEPVFHLPPLPENHSRRMVYPFVGIYLYPKNISKELDLEDILDKVRNEADETYRSEQLSRVSMETHIVKNCPGQSWIEVILEEKKEEETNVRMLEGRPWKNTDSVFSCHVISLLNMLQMLSVNNDISEMWISDYDKYRQVLPAGSDLLIDVNPVTLPIA